MKRLNIAEKPNYEPPTKLKNKDYRSSYNKISNELIIKLQNMYRYDIEVFGYPKSPFD